VREPAEYAEGHVPGAPLIPLGEVAERISEVPTGEVLVICRSGARSARAAELLRAHGIDAVNVAGGTLAWIDAGGPVVHGPAADT
jgi:rhodanese-related sulfurtransferase